MGLLSLRNFSTCLTMKRGNRPLTSFRIDSARTTIACAVCWPCFRQSHAHLFFTGNQSTRSWPMNRERISELLFYASWIPQVFNSFSPLLLKCITVSTFDFHMYIFTGVVAVGSLCKVGRSMRDLEKDWPKSIFSFKCLITDRAILTSPYPLLIASVQNEYIFYCLARRFVYGT